VEVPVMLFVGDDWAEDHHDVEVQDASGRRLAAARLPEGVEGIARFHELIGQFVDPEDEAGPGQVLIGIETERGPWVTALVAAGYRVCAINPMRVQRYRERRSPSGAKSDPADAHLLADVVRLDGHQLRQVAGDSPLAESVKAVARAHQGLIWERNRHVLRLRAVLREYFPAALEAYDSGPLHLAAPDVLELLAAAPDPATAAGLSAERIEQALARARRRKRAARTAQIRQRLRAPQLTQPAELTAAYAAITASLVAVIGVLNTQISTLQGRVGAVFARHPDAEIYRSQPGLGDILGARVLGGFGDDAHRYRDAKARKNYAGTSPITRVSGKRKTISARFVRTDRLIDALMQQAFSALSVSPGARAYYDGLRARKEGHYAALRALANRLVGILHGCLKTGRLYDEATAWGHRHDRPRAA